MLTLSSGNKYYSEAEYNKLKNKYELLEKDFTTVSQALRKEAEDREWCSDYNKFVEDVNEHLIVKELELLEREYVVEITFTRTQKVETSITITATSRQEAEDIVNDMNYDSNLNEANVKDYDWDTEEEDFEVTDVNNL